jgi:hypothetical protein
MGPGAAYAVDSSPRVGAARAFWLPWTFRRILALPGPPLAIGVIAMLLSLATDVIWFNASGLWQGLHLDGIPIWLHPYGSINLAYAVSLGISVVALNSFVRGAERDLSQLGPALELGPEALADVSRELLSVPARVLRIGTIVALAIASLDLWIGSAYAELHTFDTASIAWLVTREILYDLLFFRVFAWAVVVALRLSRLARESVRVRLFDLATLRPFTQNGVRLTFFWLLMWAIWVPVPFVGIFGADALLPLALLLATGITLSAIAIALPTRGARHCVRRAKATELAEVRGAIALDRGAALDANHPDRDAAAARLPGLLAYEARVDGISESLLDTQSLRRLGFYLLIPLASWVGGAMIERLVDAVLD